MSLIVRRKSESSHGAKLESAEESCPFISWLRACVTVSDRGARSALESCPFHAASPSHVAT